jgi:chromosome segregation ATPase
MPAARSVKLNTTTVTEVAVLQVQVQNITSDISEIKSDIKELSLSMAKNNEDNHQMLKEMKEASASAHKVMNDKISNLEKWRWMMMGAGIVLGALGHNTLG